jgi:signal transduction histidine kinase
MRAIENRLSALYGLLDRLPDSERANLIKVASVRGETISIGDRPRVAEGAARDPDAEERLREVMGANAPELRIAKRGRTNLNLFGFGPRQRGNFERMSVAIALTQEEDSEEWLNAEFTWPPGSSLLPEMIFSAIVASVALLIVAIWLSVRFSGPLRRLSLASSAMAQGKSVAPVPETGPWVLRTAANAFNVMSRRLMAVLDNQRVLLASIAHDLRTPITSMRIKSEFIADPELKERMRLSLDELQATTEAALEAAQSGMGEEPTREVEIGALIESMCTDVADLGGDVVFSNGKPLKAVCRPNEIRRATRNLVENAIRYGKRARVALQANAGSIAIVVEDDGPGLSKEQLARVFEPFVRLESSRNKATGGLGLGLTLARAVARGHGGDVTLENRQEGGLRATLTLRER